MNLINNISSDDSDQDIGSNYANKKTIKRNIQIFANQDGKNTRFVTEYNEYSSKDFINDLIVSLDFDMSEIKKHNPKFYTDNLFAYDESLERNVHLFEHFIFLAKGF